MSMGCAESALSDPEGAASGEGEPLRSEYGSPYSRTSPDEFQHMHELFESGLELAPSCSTPVQPDGPDGRGKSDVLVDRSTFTPSCSCVPWVDTLCATDSNETRWTSLFG